ncbi:MAG TPA: hypothetical protein VK569_10665, partial [Bacteroidota bacterium]|nr:hypothetical protein [Bacteroidota bacterium]
RKIHTQPIPRLGGLAVAASFGFTALLVFLTRSDLVSPPWESSLQGIGLGLTGILVLCLGMWDDIHEMGPGRKFLLQVAIATIVFLAGIRISIVSQPLGGGFFGLGWTSYPVTVFWIVGIMNALNLIDGLDGLASGVAMVALITIAAVGFVKFNDTGTAMLAVILAGSLLGFLRFNFNPARIFLGDSGSLFIGFVLAILSMLSSTKGSTAFAVLIPALSLGLSQREAVVLLYFVSSALGCSAFGLTVADNVSGVMILAVAGIAVVAGIHRLRYREFAIFRRGVLLPLYDLPFVHNPAFQIAMDLGFTAVAFVLAYALSQDGRTVDFTFDTFRWLLVGVTAVQMSVFFFSGVYKGIMRHAGVEDAVRIMKALVISLAIGVGLHYVAGFDLSGSMTKTFLLDFYFLLTLLVMSRFSFAVLNRIAHETQEDKDPVVIYGTGERAVVVARLLLNSPELKMRPVGFLDDSRGMEGKSIHGYPVFGGIWKVESLIRHPGIRGIIIATDDIKPGVLSRLRKLSVMHRLPVRSFTPTFQVLAPEPESQPAFQPAFVNEAGQVVIPRSSYRDGNPGK